MDSGLKDIDAINALNAKYDIERKAAQPEEVASLTVLHTANLVKLVASQAAGLASLVARQAAKTALQTAEQSAEQVIEKKREFIAYIQGADIL